MNLFLSTVVAIAFLSIELDTDAEDPATIKAVNLGVVPHYCEGVVFDYDGFGYLSEGKRIVRFTLEGELETWAETGAPNGHKVLADGTHLVCDASHHAVLHLSSDGTMLKPVAAEANVPKAVIINKIQNARVFTASLAVQLNSGVNDRDLEILAVSWA